MDKQNAARNCKVCGQPVVENEFGVVVHVGGGQINQKCRSCGWNGGQVGKFSTCPRCGDGTNLIDEHTAL